jgi:hypothetical protein
VHGSINGRWLIPTPAVINAHSLKKENRTGEEAGYRISILWPAIEYTLYIYELDQLQLCHHTNCNSTENHFVQQMFRLSQLQMCDLHRFQLDGLAVGCGPIAIRPN